MLSQALHFIIIGYTRDRIGERFIRGRSYQLIRTKDGKAISPSEFPSAIEPEQQLEISIVIPRVGDQCPRCERGIKASALDVWMTWKVPSRRYACKKPDFSLLQSEMFRAVSIRSKGCRRPG